MEEQRLVHLDQLLLASQQDHQPPGLFLGEGDLPDDLLDRRDLETRATESLFDSVQSPGLIRAQANPGALEPHPIPVQFDQVSVTQVGQHRFEHGLGQAGEQAGVKLLPRESHRQGLALLVVPDEGQGLAAETIEALPIHYLQRMLGQPPHPSLFNEKRQDLADGGPGQRQLGENPVFIDDSAGLSTGQLSDHGLRIFRIHGLQELQSPVQIPTSTAARRKDVQDHSPSDRDHGRGPAQDEGISHQGQHRLLQFQVSHTRLTGDKHFRLQRAYFGQNFSGAQVEPHPAAIPERHR